MLNIRKGVLYMKKSMKVFILVSASVIAVILAVMVVFALLHKNTENQNSETDFSEQSDVIVYEQPHVENKNDDLIKNNNLEATETLSAEDKKVQNEIAKYSSANVDFRNKKHESLNGKDFDLTFSEIESVDNINRVIYKNNSDDEFAYNIGNGKLRYAVINSAVTTKTEKSVDKQTAQQIATEYVSAKLNIADYKIDNYKETDDGHYFCFVRYIGGYPSTDKYSIQIGFDGSVVYISDFTDTFDGKKIDYDKAFIDEKIKANTDESKVDWSSVNINLNDNKVTVFVTLTEDNAICAIPLE